MNVRVSSVWAFWLGWSAGAVGSSVLGLRTSEHVVNSITHALVFSALLTLVAALKRADN